MKTSKEMLRDLRKTHYKLETQQARLLAVARAAKRIVDSDRWRGLMHIDDLEAALAAVEDLL